MHSRLQHQAPPPQHSRPSSGSGSTPEPPGVPVFLQFRLLSASHHLCFCREPQGKRTPARESGWVCRQERKDLVLIPNGAPGKPGRGRRRPRSCSGRRRSPSWGARARPARCCPPPTRRAWGYWRGRCPTCRRSRRKEACTLGREQRPHESWTPAPRKGPDTEVSEIQGGREGAEVKGGLRGGQRS